MPQILSREHIDLALRLREDEGLIQALHTLKQRLAEIHDKKLLKGLQLIEAEEKAMFDTWKLCGRNISMMMPWFFPNFPKKAPMSMLDRPFNMVLLYLLPYHAFVLRGSRQIGKTVSIGSRQRTHAHIFHGLSSMYIAPHTEPLNTYCRKYVDIDRAFRFPSPVGDKFKQLKQYKEYPNGSKVEMVRVQTSATPVRGKTYDECIIDECIAPYTYVLLANNLKKFVVDLTPGELVVSFDAHNKITYDKVRGIKFKGIRATWTLTLIDGSAIVCTANEKIKTERGWVYLFDILPEKERSRSGEGSRAEEGQQREAAAEVRGSGLSGEMERLEEGVQGQAESCWITEDLKILVLKDGAMVPVGIESVEYAGEQEVWDIETENHHTFFANGIAVHNCQLFDPGLETEVLEVLSDSRIKSMLYAGTSTTTETLLEHRYQEGTQGVWHVLLDDGKTVNCGNADEVMPYIGEYCMVDPKSGKPINPLRGFYKYENPSGFEQNIISVHIPQIINPDKVNSVSEWNGIYKTMIRDKKKMIQEKLGIPVAEANQEVSESDLKRICVIPDGPDERKKKCRDGHYRLIVSGFDWGGSDYNPLLKTKISTTCHAILGVSPDDKVHILHVRRHAGKDYKTIMNQIVADHMAHAGGAMASDFGGGQQYHALLRTHPNVNASRHVIFDYSAPESAICAPSKTSTLENMLMLNRTESITALYLAIVMDNPMILAPSWDEMEDYLRDFLNMNRVLIDKERGHKGRRFVYHRHPSRTDDVVHALNFAYSLLRLCVQQLLIEDPAARTMIRNAVYGGNPNSMKSFNPFAKALSDYATNYDE
jgi:hypothetical protein